MMNKKEERILPEPTLTISPKEKNHSGAEILLMCLQKEGVQHIWGYPGDTILPIYDALYRQDKIHHLLVRHEQAATHAADGYARATGEVGVALVSSGPGITNAITGIAAAYMDSVPMVVISGQVKTSLIGEDAFQECDAIGITRPIVKHNILIKSIAELTGAIKKAFHIARTGRPGPVLIAIPQDILEQKEHFDYPASIVMRSYAPVTKGHLGQIKKALQMLLMAERPCVYIGGGIISANAQAEITQLATLLKMPVITSMMGLGALAGDHPSQLGMVGKFGNYEANMCISECDVLFAMGVRFDDRVISNPALFARNSERKIIHVDIDPSSISKRVRADIPLVGDAKEVLKDILEIIRTGDLNVELADWGNWWARINEWKQKKVQAYAESDQVIKPQRVIQTLYEMTKDDDVYLTSDVGQHQLWVTQYYQFSEPRRWICSGGFGAMGVGLPYALGVKKAFPHAEVFCVTSEGSLQKNIQELGTSSQHQLPIILLALNNSYLGASRQWQETQQSSEYTQHYMKALPDLSMLMQSYRHVALLVEDPKDIEAAIREARSIKDRSVLIDFRTDPSEEVYPFVPEGMPLTEMQFRGEKK